MTIWAALEAKLFRALDRRWRARATDEELHLAAVSQELDRLTTDGAQLVQRISSLSRAVRLDGSERWELLQRFHPPEGS